MLLPALVKVPGTYPRIVHTRTQSQVLTLLHVCHTINCQKQTCRGRVKCRVIRLLLARIVLYEERGEHMRAKAEAWGSTERSEHSRHFRNATVHSAALSLLL
jgi:hypothetical protein